MPPATEAFWTSLDNGDAVSMKVGPLWRRGRVRPPSIAVSFSERETRRGRSRYPGVPDGDGTDRKEAALPHMFLCPEMPFLSAQAELPPTCGTEDGSFSSVIDSLKVPSSRPVNWKQGRRYISLWDGAMAVRTGDHYTLFPGNRNVGI